MSVRAATDLDQEKSRNDRTVTYLRFVLVSLIRIFKQERRMSMHDIYSKDTFAGAELKDC